MLFAASSYFHSPREKRVFRSSPFTPFVRSSPFVFFPLLFRRASLTPHAIDGDRDRSRKPLNGTTHSYVLRGLTIITRTVCRTSRRRAGRSRTVTVAGRVTYARSAWPSAALGYLRPSPPTSRSPSGTQVRREAE